MDDDQEPASALAKLSLVMWKNVFLLIRKPLDFLIFLFLSIALICTFCILRETHPQVEVADISYPSQALNRTQ